MNSQQITYGVNKIANHCICDYKKISSFPSRYLNTYYKEIHQDENLIMKFIVDEFKKIGKRKSMIDIGCGPTIHHLLPAVPYISHIDIADYLPENLRLIQSWKTGHNESHNWNHFTRAALEYESCNCSPKSIFLREELLKNKIRKISYCNVLRKNPLGMSGSYDVVGSFYCAEEVGIKKEIWKEVMKNIASLVKPGGLLLLSALRATNYYSIQGLDGTDEKLPTVFLLEKDFYQLLPDLNFDLKKTIINVVQTPKQENQGINSVILVSAYKSNYS